MGAELPLPAIRSQIASALDLIIHLGRLRDGSRKVLQISEIGGCENGKWRFRSLFAMIGRRGAQTHRRAQKREKLRAAGYCQGKEVREEGLGMEPGGPPGERETAGAGEGGPAESCQGENAASPGGETVMAGSGGASGQGETDYNGYGQVVRYAEVAAVTGTGTGRLCPGGLCVLPRSAAVFLDDGAAGDSCIRYIKRRGLKGGQTPRLNLEFKDGILLWRRF